MKPWEIKKLYAKLIILGEYPICSLCGGQIRSMDDFTFDHIVPKSHGGPNTVDNYQPAHRDCNENRGNKSLRRKEVIEAETSAYVKIHYTDIRGGAYDIVIVYGPAGQVRHKYQQFMHKKNHSNPKRRRFGR